ncbi:MAG: 30S ribosomal protein S17 [Deltaproteobacteria bacterium RIFOXYA12_FULL_58_15]|nr:MAG: 30S ribosomal protein S17 [Deltaproteobacteria bacterium RIFOXYA12_FULL_58_15]OGR15335.1 MAG: 30S ribosomal protein S17 [Deltaproteobacteria bacterium RIFOXYB12_FULL_58_9]
MSATAENKTARVRHGVVVSNKMDKTVVVEVSRRVQHPKYMKYVRRRKRYKAHDAANECNVGDKVVLEETRPMSKDKRWRVKEISGRAVV